MMQSTYGAVLLAAALATTALTGLTGAAHADEAAVGEHPNNRANHHPVHDSIREHQAVVTPLGNGATAVSYWASAPDGWHVVTTVDTVVGQDTDAEQHAIVRFSAMLAPGQEQLISVPGQVGTQPIALRVRRTGDRIEMMRVADPAM